MNRVITGLQPTNFFHIGNYFGAIDPMLQLQSENDMMMFIVDYHAITVPQNPEELRKNILFAAATYLAAGIDPTKTILFQQSRVLQHTELAWILTCIAKMGEMERMTQFKDKASGKLDLVSVGLFTYPILMAADILLYDVNVVPVGADQKQHVELARDLAIRFNKMFGDTFVVPEPLIRREGARIMGLDDPSKKMSKSAASPKNYISLMDDEATIGKKIRGAVTDSGTEVRRGDARPAISNLLTLYSLVTEAPIDEIEKVYHQKGYGDFKVGLANAVWMWLAPLQEKIKQHLVDEANLIKVLEDGAEKARVRAEAKMKIVRQKIGVAL